MSDVNFHAKTEKYPDIKRFFIISDTHFGVRSNSIEWMEIQKDYFTKWFIPHIKEMYKPGDALIHCGDVFDSRQSMNLKVMNMAMEIFEEISKLMPVFMICGNHDIYYKTSNSVNSIKMFNWLPNVRVYEEPVILEINNGISTALLMPWQDSHEDESQIIQTNKADYLFCHTDFRGVKFNARVDVEDGNEIESVNQFKRVYSGHIHYAQKNQNIRMVGCPYPLTRSDNGNVKHFWILNFENDTEEGTVNNYSPKFVKIKLEKALETTYEDMKLYVDNNFVDILVNSSWAAHFPFSSFLEAFANIKYRKLNYIITSIGSDEETDGDYDENSEEVDLPTLIDLHIEGLSYSELIKQKLKEVSRALYQKSLRVDIDETIG
jgi:calcineurin-like phosphoesterase family protein